MSRAEWLVTGYSTDGRQFVIDAYLECTASDVAKAECMAYSISGEEVNS